MNKAYERINWENYPSTETPLNEDNLNRIDRAVDILDNRVIELDASKFDKSTAQKLVKNISFNEENGKITITYYDGSKDIIETFLEDADVLELQDNLIKYHAVVQKLVDSDDNPILDSNGNEIYGKTVYADQTDIVSIYNSLSSVKAYLASLNAARPLSRLTEEEKKSQEMSADIAGLETSLQKTDDHLLQQVGRFDDFEKQLGLSNLVTLPLLDSAGQPLLDSAGRPLQARTLYASTGQVLAVQSRLSALEQYDNMLNSFRVMGRIKELETRMQALEEVDRTISASIESLNDSISALSTSISAITQRLDNMDTYFAGFEQNLAMKQLITLPLLDSSGVALQDSDGRQISSRSIFATQSSMLDTERKLEAVSDYTQSLNQFGVKNRIEAEERKSAEAQDSIEMLSADTEALRQADVALNASVSSLNTQHNALSQSVQALEQDLDDVSLQIVDNIVDFAGFKDALAVQRTITLNLQDSSNQPLLDSSGYAVQARTVYAEQGQIIDITNNLSAVERHLDGINKSGVANRMAKAEANLKELNDHAILDNII